MSKRPKTVKIFNYEYRIESTERRYTDAAKCWGWIDGELETIFLSKSMSPSREREILLHEILHALIDLMQLDKAKEEEICKRLSMALLTVLKDNPQLAIWLLEE